MLVLFFIVPRVRRLVKPKKSRGYVLRDFCDFVIYCYLLSMCYSFVTFFFLLCYFFFGILFLKGCDFMVRFRSRDQPFGVISFEA